MDVGVTGAAEPPDLQRLSVVVVVGFYGLAPEAAGAEDGLREPSGLQRGFDGPMGCDSLRVLTLIERP